MQIIEHRTLVLAAALAVAVPAPAFLVLARHDHDVRVVWQPFIRSITGKVARNRTGHASNHRIGRIEDRIARTQIEIRLAAKWQGITRLFALPLALNSTLHPHHAAAGNVGFQRRDGCRVVRNKVRNEVVVPVKDDHPILSEIEPGQVSWRKYSKGMPSRSDGILNNGCAKRIVSLEDGKVVRGRLAIGEGEVDDVAGDKCEVIWRETDG